MTLQPGARIGPYQLEDLLGAGGMGEVYRATDTRLRRSVAIKVLPASVTGDPERASRFEREAQLLASLNHPNIAQVYGFEAVTLPSGEGASFLTMELVPGEDLAQRLQRGPLPLDEALRIARGIAEALEEAHERGIVHRDLKPANVKVTPDGKVKVLDFGLAKALANDPATPSSADLAQSPTFAHTATQMGVILGTAAYMAPEQARGTRVDKRADIWAFGAVLFELLTARRVFDGETVSDVLAAVLRSDPDWSALPSQLPSSIRTLLRRCLERNPRDRLHDVADARLVLDEALAGGDDETSIVTVPSPVVRRSRAPWIVAVAVGLAGIAAGWFLRTSPPPEREMQFPLALPAGWKLADADTPLVAISSDGRRRAVAAVHTDGRERLLLGDVSKAEWVELQGTDFARAPFFSPDGEWIGFFGNDHLSRVAVAGGPPAPIMEQFMGQNRGDQTRGAVWLPDGTIVYSPGAGTPLMRVRASGGEPVALTTIDTKARERTHRWPDALPDGSAVIFTADLFGTTEYYDDATIEAVVVATGERKVLIRGASQARYLDPGVLVFARGGSLFAARFDPKTLDVTGNPVPVLEGVATTVASGAVQFCIARTGDLLWVPGALSGEGGLPVWIDRRGGRSEPILEEGSYTQLDLSPDGRRLALVLDDGGKTDIWIVDVATGARSRLTFEGAVADPTWSPDSTHVLYTVTSTSVDIYWKTADGSGDAEPLVTGPEQFYSPSMSPDGRVIIFEVQSGDALDLWTYSMADRQRKPFLLTPAVERGPAISPDGRFVAYVSREAGRSEIVVRRFPGGAGPWQVSTEGGVEPRWSRSGRELYFRDRGILYRASISAGESFSSGRPERVAVGVRPGDNLRSYAPSPDGERIVMLPGWGVSAAATPINLAFGWAADVRRRLRAEQR